MTASSLTLKKFRALVRSLEGVDPRKLTREEKIAFWINIHNALMMLEYLAYGTGNRIRSTAILKAAYNVDGHSVSTYIIQTLILGILLNQSGQIRLPFPSEMPRLKIKSGRPSVMIRHEKLKWVQTLFAPRRKSKAGTTSHVNALDYPEQLVCFALATGTYSRPAGTNRQTVFADIKHAKEDYVRANVYIHKESKIFLPRIFYFFAKYMSLTVPGLLVVVGECLSQSQRKIVERSSKGRAADKIVQWLPHNSTFWCVVHGEVGRRKPAI